MDYKTGKAIKKKIKQFGPEKDVSIGGMIIGKCYKISNYQHRKNFLNAAGRRVTNDKHGRNNVFKVLRGVHGKGGAISLMEVKSKKFLGMWPLLEAHTARKRHWKRNSFFYVTKGLGGKGFSLKSG